MKLTKLEIMYLQEIGEENEDLEQIIRLCKNLTKNVEFTLYYANGKKEKIGCKKAKELLGWEQFMSGIDRAAFHWTACRQIENTKRKVLFDASNFFLKED